MDYIGISENRLHHILGVARKAYSLAKEMGYNENFARRMFMLGWNHDVGYEFSKAPEEHPDVGAEMLRNLINGNTMLLDEMDFTKMSVASWTAYDAIKKHSKYTESETTEWKILSMADLLVNSKGEEVSVSGRLEDIKNRYGEHSDQYLTACDIAYRVGLTAVNFAANIT